MKSIVAAMILVLGPTSSTLFGEEFKSGNVAIQYTQGGPDNGEVVVLLHGWFENGDVMLESKLGRKLIQQGYQVVAPDLRGHGQSDKPHRPKDYGTEMVADVVGLLKRLGIQKAKFVGYSMGAMILAKLVVDHPDCVDSAVIGGCGGIQNGFDHSFMNGFAASVQNGRQTGEAAMENWNLLGAGKLTQQLEASLGNLNGTDAKAYAAVGLGFRQLEVTEAQLGAINVPILVIYGSEEMPNNLSTSEKLWKAARNADRVVIPDATHMTASSKELYVDSIVGFLGRN